MYIVYILKSEVTGILYKGYTSNLSHRIEEHNNNLSEYTANKGPWKLVYSECYTEKKEALIREKSLKKANSKYLKWLIDNYSLL